MAKTKVELPEPVEAETDEISTVYGDLVTFMMMLFVLLFVLSYNKNQDADFFTQMNVKFGGKRQSPQESMTTDSLLISKLQNFIKKEDLDKHTQILVDEQKIKIILTVPVLFDIGKAKIKPEAFPILNGFIEVLGHVQNDIIVEGHTDDVPIHTTEFDSNWDLSFYRSYSVVKYFMNSGTFLPTKLSGIGYGEYRPITENITVEGRSQNRRIELNVIRVTRADSA
jgi:chemotaxis protein MotB